MAIAIAAGDVATAFQRVGSNAPVEVDAIIDAQGRTIFQRPALPVITSFTATPSYARQDAPAGNVTLAFAVTGSTQNRIHRLSDNGNVPLATSTSAIVAEPNADETWRLTSTNAEGSVHADVNFWRWTAPSFANVQGGHVVQPGTGARVPRILGDLTITPWLSPVLTLSPEVVGFSSRQFATSVQTGNSDTRHFLLQGDPHTAQQTVQAVDITLSAQLRIDGADVGAPATHRVQFRF